jgi:hypothetical protein
MFKARLSFLPLSFYIYVFMVASLYAMDETTLSDSSKTEVPNSLKNIWDPAKYIGVDEIEPGMEAYCLTEYGVAGIEKFSMEIVDIIHNMYADRELVGDIILVKGTDEQFIRTGPVAGCSGSPLYIDSRLAGALAFTWTYSTEPLYGATPIQDMLKVGQANQEISSEQSGSQMEFIRDFSAPIDFTEIYRQYTNNLIKSAQSPGGLSPLPCPVVTSGIPAEVCEQFRAKMEPFGLIVVAGGSGGSVQNSENVQLVPGASLCVPLVDGDIQISTFGTVTEVIDDKVYGFGHFLLGQGQIDLPMATGKVHTVVSNIIRSFKVASLVETVGALTTDEADGVIGRIGATAKTIPLTIRIDRYNDTKKRVYNCRIANHKQLTPRYLEFAVTGAALYHGNFPTEHMIEYNVAINVENKDLITFENVSSGLGLNELLTESIGSVMLLMNNPFKTVYIKSLEFNISIVPKNINSGIWSVDLSDTVIKAGEDINIEVIIDTFLAEKTEYELQMEIPENLEPGKYELIVCGAQEYERFLAKAVPYRFIATSMPDLIDALNNALGIPRDRLYCILVLPPSGVALEKSELPDLPATKAMVFQNEKRTLRIQPYQHWIEKSIQTGTVVADKKVLRITVEQ